MLKLDYMTAIKGQDAILQELARTARDIKLSNTHTPLMLRGIVNKEGYIFYDVKIILRKAK